MATFRELPTLFGRALRLRCPNCGKGALLRHWFQLQDNCSVCGFRYERGEEGYQVGSLTVNMIAIELIFAALFVGIVAITWPNVPWRSIQWGGGALMLFGPLVLFPFGRGIFLSCDLVMRPPTPEDFVSTPSVP